MSDRKPRTYTLFVCPGCGDARLDGERHGCCEESADGFAEIDVREVFGPWEDLAAAIDRIGEDKVASVIAEAIGKTEWGEDEAVTVNDLVPSLAAVRALRGAGEKDDG